MSEFRIKELPPAPETNEHEVAACWECGRYGTRGTMQTKDGKYCCNRCAESAEEK